MSEDHKPCPHCGEKPMVYGATTATTRSRVWCCDILSRDDWNRRAEVEAIVAMLRADYAVPDWAISTSSSILCDEIIEKIEAGDHWKHTKGTP